MTPLALEVLLPSARSVFDQLCRIELSSWYLAGGTGLALQLGHRISADFDFFAESVDLDFADRQDLYALLTSARIPCSVEMEKDRTVTLAIEGVRVSFFHYPYPLVDPLITSPPLRLASVRDIGAMKLSALVGRGTRRDFLDLYEIAQVIPLPDLLGIAARKYAHVDDFGFQALKALTFFEEAEEEPMPHLLKPRKWREVRAFFEREADRIAREWLR